MASSDYVLQEVKGIKESFSNAVDQDILRMKNIPVSKVLKK